jgi:hypothetical protein
MYILYSTVVWLGKPYVVEVTQTLKRPLNKGSPHEYFLKAYKIKKGLSVYVQLAFTFLTCIVKRKTNNNKVSACFFKNT